MPEARLRRTREGSREVNCQHLLWIYVNNSNLAPTIEANGDRTTERVCYHCHKIEKRTRTQQEFEAELNELARGTSR